MEKGYKVTCLGCLESVFLKSEKTPCECPICAYTSVSAYEVETEIKSPKSLRDELKISYPQIPLKVG